jgi:hypothetical protein
MSVQSSLLTGRRDQTSNEPMSLTSSSTPSRLTHRLAALLAALMALAATVQAWAYWPGLMTWDSARQYGQAIDGDFDDWHPPTMEWIWQKLLPLHSGPQPMLLLQLLLYWGGFGLLAGWALKGRRPGLAAALAACAILPIPFALLGEVLKDCLMAGALLTATGLLAWSREEGGWALRVPALLLLLFAATLRFNALLAGLPLFLALLPRDWRRTPLRFAISTGVALALLASALPLANRALGAERSGVELSLVMFDLGGISAHSGAEVFPPLGVAHPVAVNRHCYSPVKWDPYSWWVDEPCPIQFYALRDFLRAHHRSGIALWFWAVARHPLAYAEHRLTHFNINARFLVKDEIERPVQVESAPNDWHFTVKPNLALSAIDGAAMSTVGTPLGWPIWWLAVALGVLSLSPALPSRRLTVPLAISALLYGFGYLVFSVAAEMRYHLWTMIAGLLATAIAAGDFAAGLRVPRIRVLLALAPAIVIALLCTASRIG